MALRTTVVQGQQSGHCLRRRWASKGRIIPSANITGSGSAGQEGCRIAVLVAQSGVVDYRWGVEFGPPRLPYPRVHDGDRGVVFTRRVPAYSPELPLTLCRGESTSWAYSSIGQSPRLITGLFLVRTQVGPLREAGGGNRMVRSPWTRDDRSTN